MALFHHIGNRPPACRVARQHEVADIRAETEMIGIAANHYTGKIAAHQFWQLLQHFQVLRIPGILLRCQFHAGNAIAQIPYTRRRIFGDRFFRELNVFQHQRTARNRHGRILATDGELLTRTTRGIVQFFA